MKYIFVILILLAIGCEPPPQSSDGRRPIKSGDIVYHKLGMKGVIISKSLSYSDFYEVRTERSTFIEYWSIHEIESIQE